MIGILGVLQEIYIRFMVWLGAAPPHGYEHLVADQPIPSEYTLQEGETIFAVARKFGIHYERIARANEIENLEDVKAGQTLKLPPPNWTPEDGPLTQPKPQPTPEPLPEEPDLFPEEDKLEPEPEMPSDAWEPPDFSDIEVEPEPVDEPPLVDDSDTIEDVEEEQPDFSEPDWLEAAEPIPPQEDHFDEFEQIIAEEELESIEDVEWLTGSEPLEVPNVQVDDESPEQIQEGLPEPDLVPATEPIAIPHTDDTENGDGSEMVFRYEVQRGDTLSAIARRYGLTVKALVDANDIVDPNRIYPGQKLIIPGYLSPKPEPEPEPPSTPPPPLPDIGDHFIYTVASGDTLSAIAKRYGITLREIIEANDIENPNFIRVGQKLIIPGIVKPSPTPPKPEPKPEPLPTPTPPPEPEIPPEIPEEYETDPDFPPIGSLSAVRAMYMSYFAVGHPKFRERVLHLLDTTEFNAVVIDAKGDHGWISYPTQIPTAHEIGSARPTAKDFAEFMAQLKNRGAYTIARIVTFKDNPLAQGHPELAAKTTTNIIWKDNENLAWSDPFLKPAWDYNIQVALEAAQQGFDEIQFDYIRFPTPSAAGTPQFSQDATKQTRIAAIIGFLSAVSGQLKPLEVKIGADTFGYTCWRKDDTLIGQDIERMGQYLDVLCPMLYPSTFGSGIPGYKFAIAHPYEIVYHSALRAVNRLKPLGCSVRPWIQDFPDYRFDKRVYGRDEIQAQIKGSFDSGGEGFMVWDPRVQYTDGGYAPLRKRVPQTL